MAFTCILDVYGIPFCERKWLISEQFYSLKLMGKKIFTIYAQKFGLSKPMDYTSQG